MKLWRNKMRLILFLVKAKLTTEKKFLVLIDHIFVFSFLVLLSSFAFSPFLLRITHLLDVLSIKISADTSKYHYSVFLEVEELILSAV